MPQGAVPDRSRDILAGTARGHLATLGADDRPQVNPVWFIADGHHVWLGVKPDTVKYRNLRANPAVATSVFDPARPNRSVEVRGEVVAFEFFDAIAWVNQIARTYAGADFTGGHDGEHRSRITIRVDGWTGQG